jgi:hypothetical protein
MRIRIKLSSLMQIWLPKNNADPDQAFTLKQIWLPKIMQIRIRNPALRVKVMRKSEVHREKKSHPPSGNLKPASTHVMTV